MNQKEKKLRSYYLTDDMTRKLENVAKYDVGTAVFRPTPPRLTVYD